MMQSHLVFVVQATFCKLAAFEDIEAKKTIKQSFVASLALKQPNPTAHQRSPLKLLLPPLAKMQQPVAYPYGAVGGYPVPPPGYQGAPPPQHHQSERREVRRRDSSGLNTIDNL